MTMMLYNAIGDAVPTTNQLKALGFAVLSNVATRFLSKKLTEMLASYSPESFVGKTASKTVKTMKDGSVISVGDVGVAAAMVIAAKVASDYSVASIGAQNATAVMIGGSLAAVQPVVAPLVRPFLMSKKENAPAAQPAPAGAQGAGFVMPRGADRLSGNAFTARNLSAGYETTKVPVSQARMSARTN